MLRIEGLVVEYTSGGYVVRPIDGLDVTVDDGRLALLLGPSGCGKTTLLSCTAGIQRPTAGAIRFGDLEVTGLRGKDLTAYRRRTVGVVFQAFNLVPSLTAAENVEVPLLAGGMAPGAARRRAAQLLEEVGLGEKLRNRPGQLSGGQQQRVAIARALAWDPPLLLADEPTAHLDYVQVEDVLRILRRVAAPGRVVVVSTHDERILSLADTVIELSPRFQEERGKPSAVQLAAGEVLFEAGSRGDRIYVVASGEIELARALADGGKEVVAVAGPGDTFGEMGPLFGLARAATATATVESEVQGYTVRQFRELPGGVARLGRLVGAHTMEPPRRRPSPASRPPRRLRAGGSGGSSGRATGQTRGQG